jgi:hypothetical protein
VHRYSARLALLVLAVACNNADTRSALNVPVIDTLAGGVIQVTNIGPTAWADTSGWRLVEELVISPPEGSPGELSGTRGLVADEVGNVYVMQREPIRIAVFGLDGTWLREIGREGDGPGEFRDGMLGIVGDTLFVQDPSNARLTTFRTDGSFIAVHPSQCCAFTSRLPVLADGRALILGPSPNQSAGVRGAWYYTRMDGTVTDTMPIQVRREQERSDYWEVVRGTGQDQTISAINIPIKASEKVTMRRDGKLLRGRNDSYRLVIGNNFSDSLRLIVATAPSIIVTEAERDSAYQATLAQVDEDWREAYAAVAKLTDIPDTWPVWTNVTSDADNHVWVALPGDRGAYSMFQVFTPEGTLLGNVPAVVGSNLFDGFWTRDRIYVGDEDENGLPIIRVFRIVK